MAKSRTSRGAIGSADSPRPRAAIRRFGQRRRLAAVGLVVGAVLACYFFRPHLTEFYRQDLADDEPDRQRAGEGIPFVQFTDVTRQSGIRFRHQNAAAGHKLLPETMGSGCAFFDFDNDGDQDLLLVNSLSRWPWDRQTDDFPDATSTLYCNDGRGNFSDVTAGSGLDVAFYGMGVAVGDYDGDGRVDVFLSAVGKNRLFHNDGDGKFRDVTTGAGVAGGEDAWTTSCGWFDYDNDGDLDLFACNYLAWSREEDESHHFQLADGTPAYGRPQNFAGTFPYLYRNEGDGRFRDVAEETGLHVRDAATGKPLAKSLGVTFTDVDSDGWLDIVVANDTARNFLFHNQRNGTFREEGVASGLAFDPYGNTRGAMGIDAARLRGKDALGIAIGNFSDEMTAVYLSYGDEMQFSDEAIPTGVGPATRMSLTFGLFYLDYDLDGRLDLFATNGHLEDQISRVQANQTYAQRPELFWNRTANGRIEFLPASETKCGSDFFKPLVGRGASYADIDNDGDLDILITNVGGEPRLLRNDQQLGHHYLRLKLIGVGANRNAIGSSITVELANGEILNRAVMPTRSYLSQVELPLTIGLGSGTGVRRAVVTWPDGSHQEVGISDLDRIYEIRQAEVQPNADSQL